MARRAAAWPIAASALFLASLASFWPGIATYDTIAQYHQVLSGEFDDWHPPAMARLWALIAPLAPGAAPMLVVQLASYWLGLGLLATRLGRRAPAMLAIGAYPLFLAWQGVVLKDAQLAGAMVLATGIIGRWRLRGHRLPIMAIGLVAMPLTYAVLVRANAAFAVVPFAAMLLPPTIGWRRRLVGAVAGIVAVLALSGPINHGLLGATRSGVEHTQAIYDLAGIAVRSAPGGTPFDGAAVATMRAKHCVKPLFWDPLGDADRCAGQADPLQHLPLEALYAAWAKAALTHPLAYAAHRLAHLNSTERWLVARAWPSATPPSTSEANDVGLGSPGRAAGWWRAVAEVLAETPLGWPIAYVVAALILLPMAGIDATGRLARALLTSALCLEASFAVLSIASDLRYHLWPMIAVALAGVLVWRRPLPRVSRAMAFVLLAVVAGGVAARMILPVPPQSYAAQLR